MIEIIGNQKIGTFMYFNNKQILLYIDTLYYDILLADTWILLKQRG